MSSAILVAVVNGILVGLATYAVQIYFHRKRRRNLKPPKSFLDKMAKIRASHFRKNKTKCENYSPDNSKFGVSCIYPWCDYCSFYCPRRKDNG